MRQLKDVIREWVKLWRSHGLDVETILTERECEIVDLLTLTNYDLNHPQISAVIGNKQSKSSQFMMRCAINKLAQGWYWYRRDIAIAQKYKLWMVSIIILSPLISHIVHQHSFVQWWILEQSKELSIDDLPLSLHVQKYLRVNKGLKTLADIWAVYEDILKLKRSYRDVPIEINLLWFEFL